MPFGVDSSGFTVKTLDDIRTSLENRAHAAWGAGADVDYDTALGRMIGVVAGALDEGWQQIQNLYNARRIDGSDGALLDNNADVRGMSRNGATKASALLTLFGDEDAVILVNTEYGIGSTGATFLQDAEATLTAFGAGAIITLNNFSASVSVHSITIDGALYGEVSGATQQAALTALKALVDTGLGVLCTVSGTGASASMLIPGPLPVVLSQSNTNVSALSGYVVEVTAREAGSVSGAAGAIDTIISSVAGLSTVTNRTAITPGFDAETDTELRIRMGLAPAVLGINSLNAIFARLSALDDVQDVVVYENVLGVTDAQGRPPHSVHAIVYPDTVPAADIASVLWNSRAAGISTYGGEAEVLEDTQGFEHTVNFDFATEFAVDIEIDLVVNDDFPADGSEQVQVALAAAASAVRMRDSVVRVFRLYGAIDEIAGIVDATITTPASNISLAIGVKPIAGTILVNVS